MSPEFKLLALILVYGVMLRSLFYYVGLDRIKKQTQRYLPKLKRYHTRCSKHLKDLDKGEIAVISETKCDHCKCKT